MKKLEMKYKWMIIFSISLLLFYSCNDTRNKDNSKIKKIQSKIILTFVDSITKQKLDDFEFGVSNDKEELPISYILNRKNDYVIKKSDCVIIKNIDNKKENIYGYFAKKGYDINKFLLKKEISNQTINIAPESSLITIKGMDDEVVAKIDSVAIIFDFEKKGVSYKEYFKFKKNDVHTDLEYFNRQINIGQFVKVSIKVFKGLNFYVIERHIRYTAWTNTTIILI